MISTVKSWAVFISQASQHPPCHSMHANDHHAFFFVQLIELKRNPEGNIEKRGRPTIKPTLAKYKAGSHSDNDLLHKTKVRNAKLRKELRNIDEQIQVRAMHISTN